MDYIKDAFQKVKEDIDALHHEMSVLKSELEETRKDMFKIGGILDMITNKITQKQGVDVPTREDQNPIDPTHPSTHNLPLEPLKDQYNAISTGNGGVPTDRQTDKQTNRQQEISLKSPENSIDNAAKILDSLDSIKKEIRLKFKRLTDQEVLVFSTLYQIDEETGPADYKTIAVKLNLTESSIRDYIGRLIRKGIPVEKKRINNKNISLSISKNLKKIASLSTILQLRDI